MLAKNSLSLAEAKAIAEAACISAGEKKVCISVAVVDVTTYAQVTMRMDGAPLMSAQGALDKAVSSAEGGHPTTFFEKPLNAGRISMLKLPHTPIEGGLPVIVNGQCVGAVGVGGAPPSVDAQIAQEAIESFLKEFKE